MENKINIVELLKDCPTGMELDCTMYNKVTLLKVDTDDTLIFPITIVRQDGNLIKLTKYGQYANVDFAKCIIFPKGKTTWEGFQIPFKDGDIIVSSLGGIHIMQGSTTSYCHFDRFGFLDKTRTTSVRVERLATEEEKEKLFKAIKDNGYRWDTKNKTLEKLPMFKVGDRIILKDNPHNIPSIRIKAVTKSQYILENEGFFYIDSTDEKYVLEDKFDINTLKPFESKVLVRDSKKFSWRPALYGGVDYQSLCPFITVGGMMYKCMIPYEGNEHLLGTTDDCDEYFKLIS